MRIGQESRSKPPRPVWIGGSIVSWTPSRWGGSRCGLNTGRRRELVDSSRHALYIDDDEQCLAAAAQFGIGRIYHRSKSSSQASAIPFLAISPIETFPIDFVAVRGGPAVPASGADGVTAGSSSSRNFRQFRGRERLLK